MCAGQAVCIEPVYYDCIIKNGGDFALFVLNSSRRATSIHSTGPVTLGGLRKIADFFLCYLAKVAEFDVIFGDFMRFCGFLYFFTQCCIFLRYFVTLELFRQTPKCHGACLTISGTLHSGKYPHQGQHCVFLWEMDFLPYKGVMTGSYMYVCTVFLFAFFFFFFFFFFF